MAQMQTSPKKKYMYPLLPSKERLSLLQSIKGMLKHHKRNTLQELKKLRRERERATPTHR